MSKNNTGISRHVIDFLFNNARFNLRQVEQIKELCLILAKYMFVDRNLLEKRSKNGIGLSFIKKAAYYNFIAELQEENQKGKKNIYYYQLGQGGIYLLQKAEYNINQMNILAGKEEKQRILTFNYFALENNIEPEFCGQDQQNRFFMCKNNTVCYFNNHIKENKIIQKLCEALTTKESVVKPEQIREMYKFLQIDKKMIEIGAKTQYVKN